MTVARKYLKHFDVKRQCFLNGNASFLLPRQFTEILAEIERQHAEKKFIIVLLQGL